MWVNQRSSQDVKIQLHTSCFREADNTSPRTSAPLRVGNVSGVVFCSFAKTVGLFLESFWYVLSMVMVVLDD